MSDNLWRELAQVNREEQEDERDRLDERWDRLSRGELSPEEDAELRALAETSEEARAAYEAFKPLGPDFQASVVQAIRKQGLTPEAEAVPTQPPAKPLPFRRRFAGWSAVAALATAASVVMLLRPLSPLPDYSLEITGSVSEMRGEEVKEVPVLAPGDGFTVYVRPATAVPSGSKLEALCFLAREGELRLLEARSEIVPEGTVRMEVSLDRDLPPGSWTLWAVVGRRGKLPDPAVLQTSASATGAGLRKRDWVTVLKNVRIQLRGPSQL